MTAAGRVLPRPVWVSEQQIPAVFGISGRFVINARNAGADIKRRYLGSKPVYEVDSISRWIDSHPEDKEQAS